jgi:phospholipid/cholesterol/gamma-HCH transport system substrate-binding protein
VRKLQTFTGALAGNDSQVRDFATSLQQVSGQLSGERQDLAAMLSELSTVLTKVAGFVQQNRGRVTGSVGELTQVSKVLVDEKSALQEILEVGPTGLDNLARTYDPNAAVVMTRANFEELRSPGMFVCSLLKTSGKDPDCPLLRKLLDPLGELTAPVTGNSGVGTDGHGSGGGSTGGTSGGTDKTLGGILGGGGAS